MINKTKLDKAIDIRNKYLEDVRENGIDLGDDTWLPCICVSSASELEEIAEELGIDSIATTNLPTEDDYEYQTFCAYRGVKIFYMKAREKK